MSVAFSDGVDGPTGYVSVREGVCAVASGWEHDLRWSDVTRIVVSTDSDYARISFRAGGRGMVLLVGVASKERHPDGYIAKIPGRLVAMIERQGFMLRTSWKPLRIGSEEGRVLYRFTRLRTDRLSER